MLLSRPEILRAIKVRQIVLRPFKANQVGPGSIDLTLGSIFRVFHTTPKNIRVKENTRPERFSKQISLKKGQHLNLRPGELVLGITQERVQLAPILCARIEGRSRFARLGLMVHISSSVIHPGSNNHPVLEIVNLGPHTLQLMPGLRICQITLEEVKGRAQYAGRFRTQRHV